MKKNFAFALCSLLVASVAQAGSFTIEGDVGDRSAPGLSGGTLQIMYEGPPSFANGGIRLELVSSQPGVIEFSDATVENGGRWTAVTATDVAADRVGTLEAFSILTPGLPTSGKNVYATVNYTIVGPGTTILSLAPTGLDPLIDGELGDVSSSTQLGTAEIFVPEPGTMALASLSLIGLVLRRRG